MMYNTQVFLLSGGVLYKSLNNERYTQVKTNDRFDSELYDYYTYNDYFLVLNKISL